jgi:hypothetical protein
MATMATSAAGPEAEAAWAEARAEAAAESRPESGAPACCRVGTHLVLQLLAQFALGFTPCVVHRAAALRVERIEVEPACLWAIIVALEWVGHVCLISDCGRKQRVRFRCIDDISKCIAMQSFALRASGSSVLNFAFRRTPDVADTDSVPLNDFVRHVNDVLARANTLFGSVGLVAPAAASAQRLSDAADAVRRVVAPDMAGAAVAGYRDYAHQKATALERLADADATLNGVLQDAAEAENAAAAASTSTASSAAAHTQHLRPETSGPTGERAVIAALHSEVERQQDLVRRHQQRAIVLAEQVRSVAYI